MDRAARTWHLERTTPVRADAESIFVPCIDLSDATIGDTVVVNAQDDDDRVGTIADRTQRAGEPFVRIVFDT